MTKKEIRHAAAVRQAKHREKKRKNAAMHAAGNMQTAAVRLEELGEAPPRECFTVILSKLDSILALLSPAALGRAEEQPVAPFNVALAAEPPAPAEKIRFTNLWPRWVYESKKKIRLADLLSKPETYTRFPHRGSAFESPNYAGIGGWRFLESELGEVSEAMKRHANGVAEHFLCLQRPADLPPEVENPWLLVDAGLAENIVKDRMAGVDNYQSDADYPDYTDMKTNEVIP